MLTQGVKSHPVWGLTCPNFIRVLGTKQPSLHSSLFTPVSHASNTVKQFSSPGGGQPPEAEGRPQYRPVSAAEVKYTNLLRADSDIPPRQGSASAAAAAVAATLEGCQAHIFTRGKASDHAISLSLTKVHFTELGAFCQCLTIRGNHLTRLHCTPSLHCTNSTHCTHCTH